MRKNKLFVIVTAVFVAVAVLTVTVWAVTSKPDNDVIPEIAGEKVLTEDKKAATSLETTNEEDALNEQPQEETGDVQQNVPIAETPQNTEKEPTNVENIPVNAENPNVTPDGNDEVNIGGSVDITPAFLTDADVQAEIAKYNPNAVEFKLNMQENFCSKKYDLTFIKVGGRGDDKDQRVTYRTEEYDEFIYDMQTGKLYSVLLSSAYMVEDYDESKKINAETAEKIAYTYVKNLCDINEYSLDFSDEVQCGYRFGFYKKISGFYTSDEVSITVDFNGQIVRVENNSGAFDGIVIDTQKVNNKIAEICKKYEDKKDYEYSGTTLDVKNGKVIVRCLISYVNDMGYFVGAEYCETID